MVLSRGDGQGHASDVQRGSGVSGGRGHATWPCGGIQAARGVALAVRRDSGVVLAVRSGWRWFCDVNSEVPWHGILKTVDNMLLHQSELVNSAVWLC